MQSHGQRITLSAHTVRSRTVTSFGFPGHYGRHYGLGDHHGIISAWQSSGMHSYAKRTHLHRHCITYERAKVYVKCHRRDTTRHYGPDRFRLLRLSAAFKAQRLRLTMNGPLGSAGGPPSILSCLPCSFLCLLLGLLPFAFCCLSLSKLD